MIKDDTQITQYHDDNIKIVNFEFNGFEYLAVLKQYGTVFKLNKSSVELRIQNLKQSNKETGKEEYILMELKRLNKQFFDSMKCDLHKGN